MGLRLHHRDVHAERCQYLAYAVVQFASQALAFLILHFQQTSGKVAQTLVRGRKFDGSFLNSLFKMVTSFSQRPEQLTLLINIRVGSKPADDVAGKIVKRADSR